MAIGKVYVDLFHRPCTMLISDRAEQMLSFDIKHLLLQNQAGDLKRVRHSATQCLIGM